MENLYTLTILVIISSLIHFILFFRFPLLEKRVVQWIRHLIKRKTLPVVMATMAEYCFKTIEVPSIVVFYTTLSN